MKKFIAVLLAFVLCMVTISTVSLAESSRIGKASSIDSVINSIFSIYTSTAYGTARENLLKAVRSEIVREGKFIGVVYNEYGEHCWFFELHGWTILMRNNEFIWCIPWDGGKLYPADECIRYDGYEWFYAEHLESPDNVESEMLMLWWMEWRHEEEPDEAEGPETSGRQIIHIN